MARRIALLGAILSTPLVILVTAHVQAGKKSDSVVKVTATASKLDASGKQIVTVTLVHDKTWHTYANPTDNNKIDSNQTVVTVNAKTKPVSVKFDYPVGKLQEDSFFGPYRIYEDTVVIRAIVQRAQGDNSPLEISVRICACDPKNCLFPAQVPLTVP